MGAMGAGLTHGAVRGFHPGPKDGEEQALCLDIRVGIGERTERPDVCKRSKVRTAAPRRSGARGPVACSSAPLVSIKGVP